MNPALKDENVQQWEAWVLLGLLLGMEGVGILLLAAGEMMFTGFISRFSELYSRTVTDLITLGYCLLRFGGIKADELLPRKADWFVLGLAALIVFWYFGLTVGREGISTRTYDSIRNLPDYQYWLSVVRIAGIGPLLEELLFRRYFLEILRRHYSTAIALLIATGVAVLFHVGLPIYSLIFMFFAQLLFGFVYVKSRLGVSVMVHALMNWLILLLSR